MKDQFNVYQYLLTNHETKTVILDNVSFETFQIVHNEFNDGLEFRMFQSDQNKSFAYLVILCEKMKNQQSVSLALDSFCSSVFLRSIGATGFSNGSPIAMDFSNYEDIECCNITVYLDFEIAKTLIYKPYLFSEKIIKEEQT